MHSLCSAAAWITSAPQARQQLQVKQLEAQKEGLQRALEVSEGQRVELLGRYREEVAAMQSSITELRRADAKNPHLMHQIGELETALRGERERRTRLGVETAALKAELADRDAGAGVDAGVGVGIGVGRDRGEHDGALQAQALRECESEVARLSGERDHLSRELSAAAHHREVLRGAVQGLEERVRRGAEVEVELGEQLAQVQGAKGGYGDSLYPPHSQPPHSQQQGEGHHSTASHANNHSDLSNNLSHNPSQNNLSHNPSHNLSLSDVGTAELLRAGETQLRRQALRYRARAAAFQDLCEVYRAGVLALYPDGTSYSSAQHAHTHPNTHPNTQQPPTHTPIKTQPHSSTPTHAHAHPAQASVGWIQREIGAVRQSFEEEVRALDVEAGELRAKLRQSQSYILELRRRFEENVRALYRSGKGHAVSESTALNQLQQLRHGLEEAHTQLAAASQEAERERLRSRGRHSTLVASLGAALEAKDRATGALGRVQRLCEERGVDLGALNLGLGNLGMGGSGMGTVTGAGVWVWVGAGTGDHAERIVVERGAPPARQARSPAPAYSHSAARYAPSPVQGAGEGQGGREAGEMGQGTGQGHGTGQGLFTYAARQPATAAAATATATATAAAAEAGGAATYAQLMSRRYYPAQQHQQQQQGVGTATMTSWCFPESRSAPTSPQQDQEQGKGQGQGQGVSHLTAAFLTKSISQSTPSHSPFPSPSATSQFSTPSPSPVKAPARMTTSPPVPLACASYLAPFSVPYSAPS
ncbi:hypothetical protein B484DRAFT_448977, partial [Ochromonadaceae sp. CCMP2298]